MNIYTRLKTKMNLIKYHLPYGCHGYMDECLAMIECLHDEHLARNQPQEFLTKEVQSHNVD